MTAEEVVNKYNFAGVFKEAWDESLKPSTIVNSFRASGICPLNKDAIPRGKLLPSSSYEISNTSLNTTSPNKNSDPFDDDRFANLDDVSTKYTGDSVT